MNRRGFIIGAVALTTASVVPQDASAGTSLEGCHVESYGVDILTLSPPCELFATHWPTPSRYHKIGTMIPVSGTLTFRASQ